MVPAGEWSQQLESLVKEVFSSITIDAESLTSVEPKQAYAPLFATTRKLTTGLVSCLRASPIYQACAEFDPEASSLPSSEGGLLQ